MKASVSLLISLSETPKPIDAEALTNDPGPDAATEIAIPPASAFMPLLSAAETMTLPVPVVATLLEFEMRACVSTSISL